MLAWLGTKRARRRPARQRWGQDGLARSFSALLATCYHSRLCGTGYHISSYKDTSCQGFISGVNGVSKGRMKANEPLDLVDNMIADWRRERPRAAPEAMLVVGRIIRLGRLYEGDVSRMLRTHGLSYSDFDVLATLRRSGEPYELTPTQLRKNVLLTSGAMTACLRRLESAGLVSRAAGQPDRRRLSAKLTPTGYDLVERLIDRRFELARTSVAGLSPTQFAAIDRLLRQLGA